MLYSTLLLLCATGSDYNFHNPTTAVCPHTQSIFGRGNFNSPTGLLHNRYNVCREFIHIIVSMLLYSYFKSLSLYVGECPTMMELIRFRGRSRRINIPKEIGTKCYQFGVLFLKDETGARIETVIRKHLNDAEQINMEIFKLLFAAW